MDQISELNPDLIAFQEVSLKAGSSNAHWLAHELNLRKDENDDVYNLYLCPKTGVKERQEGLAILSRFPVKRHEILDLLTQNRVAQLVTFRLDGQVLMLVNGHFYWQPGVSPQRQAQVELLLDWLDTQPAEIPVVVTGDFNGLPDTPAIELMRTYFDSAYRAVHEDEPAYTAPTPMPVSTRVKILGSLARILGNRPRSDPAWKGTLDYIFVDPRLHTEDCRLVLDRADENDPNTYPSDHYGLYAVIKVN